MIVYRSSITDSCCEGGGLPSPDSGPLVRSIPHGRPAYQHPTPPLRATPVLTHPAGHRLSSFESALRWSLLCSRRTLGPALTSHAPTGSDHPNRPRLLRHSALVKTYLTNSRLRRRPLSGLGELGIYILPPLCNSPKLKSSSDPEGRREAFERFVTIIHHVTLVPLCSVGPTRSRQAQRYLCVSKLPQRTSSVIPIS